MIAQSLSLSLSFPAISDRLQVTIENQLHKKNYSSHHHHHRQHGWLNGEKTSYNDTKECAAEKKQHRFANSEP